MFTDCNVGLREVGSDARNVTPIMANQEARGTVEPMGQPILPATAEGRLAHPGTSDVYEVDYLPYTDLKRRPAHRR